MGRVARLVVGYGLMVAGVLIAAWGVLVIGLGGDGGSPGHPFAGIGIVILVAGVAVIAASFFVLLSKRGIRRPARPS